MKIIQCIPDLDRGGAERLLLNLAEELTRLGHEVMVIVIRNQNNYKDLSENVKVEVAPSQVSYSILGNHDIKTDKFDQLVNEFQPDVIHSHLLESEFVSRHNWRPKCVYVTHWHGCPPLTNPTPINNLISKEAVWKWNTKRILKQKYKASKTHFICISDFIGDYLKQNLGIAKQSISIIHNAIDLELFRPMELPKKEGFRLISIGSLNKNKNQVFLLELMRYLLDQGHSDIFLDLYGSGQEAFNLKRKITELGLENHSILHGVSKKVEQEINRAHLLVHSAWHEPFGLIIIEAMACGTPVISFNTGGSAELISDGKDGYLVAKDDLKGFANRVLELKGNEDKRRRFTTAAIESAQRFGLGNYTKKIEALYQELAVARGINSAQAKSSSVGS
jgi:glycosyltransferase involved in cell wall biosynthesis